ncbi:hypothetical protein JTE90_007850 [Oedothorax gibbosus]|uniref:Uncharacterized protein n=1 Tax=Oedothorax gibbosus TaxID=931172 RepID=A0AAV6VHF7_9ARAC|nr:hypothetical protein JTE90_007850 [Oedothorax gibbosus]
MQSSTFRYLRFEDISQALFRASGNRSVRALRLGKWISVSLGLHRIRTQAPSKSAVYDPTPDIPDSSWPNP